MPLRRWLWIGLVVAFLVGLAAIGAGVAITSRPAWYEPQAIDYSRLDADKRALAALLDRIGDELNAGREVRIELSEDQLNRWLTARSELPQGEQLELPGARLPVLSLLDRGRVRLAATVARGDWSTVFSAGLTLDVSSERIRVQLDSASAGRLPIPMGAIRQALAEQLERGRGRYRMADDGSVEIPNSFVWPNGKKRFGIRTAEISDGNATVVLEPR